MKSEPLSGSTDRFETLAARAIRLRTEGVRGRYAPSPTGAQHLGNIRTALLAWMQARLQGGVFILRMEDLDLPRVKPGSAAGILDDLEWIGIDWDAGGGIGGESSPYVQSERGELYAMALRVLEQKGLVFECTCSRKDIRLAASAPHGNSPVYPGTCREARHASRDRPRSSRFRIPDRTMSFVDRVAGRISQDMRTEVGDFVLKRKDGLFAYQLAVVVDDALMGISDVVRGIDLIDSTPRQILLYEALDLPPPDFWHVPLMHSDEGTRMSKRFESTTIEAYRAGGGGAHQLVGELAASIGLVEAGTRLSSRDLLAVYDIDEFRRRLKEFTKSSMAPPHPIPLPEGEGDNNF